MVKRKLPSSARNPQLAPDETPQHSILVERRRLGQTDLHVKQGSGSPGPKAEKLGMFDYAHLRVPLPTDLHNSGIFTPLKNGMFPESYFLMRRSDDGYISATGMFKAAFPWATTEEEQLERKYHKSIQTGAGEEVAGNVWIAPEDSLKLAQEYGIRPWILALLDHAPIEVGSKEKIVGTVEAPPPFKFSAADKKLLAPPDLSASTSSRSKRSISPGGTPQAARKIASPRKRRAASKQPEGEEKAAPKSSRKVSKAASEAAQANGVNGEVKQEDKSALAATPIKEETARVEVKETHETKGDTEIIETTVSVTLPQSASEVPEQDGLAMLEKAREMVEEANKHEHAVAGGASSAAAPLLRQQNGSRKRKASTNLTKDDADAEADSTALVQQPAAKRVKTELEEKLAKERVRNRAVFGLTATLAIGAIIPYFL